uniref:Variant surface glycoprotein 1125.4198 n=1 Tax=Trypanosoma brucei TaxID=5691 RepID=A0A1J0R9X2_9TRYP|nr:variant surface glycoprotein 1125.4198 [Trypanosoma brucei]
MRCALLIFVLATNLSDQAAASVTEGENYNDFSVLCGLVSFAQTTVDDRKAGTDIQTILKQLNTINLTICDTNIRKAIKAQNKKKWANLGATEQNQLAGYKDNWDLWTEAMAHSETEATAAALKEWEKHRNNEAVKKQIHHLTETALTTAKQANDERPKLLAATITTHLNKALYGETGLAKDLKASSSTRANVCGKGGDGNSGDDARKALLLDVLCMCAYEATDTNAGKASCKGCEGSPKNGAWTSNQDGSARAEFLVSKCPANMKPQAPSRAELAARLAAFDRVVHNAKGSGQAEKFVLGVVGGSGAAGCTGEYNAGNNKGRCVKYNEASILTGTPPLAWRTNLAAAVSAWEAREAAASKLDTIQQQLHILNSTVATLLWQQATAAVSPSEQIKEKMQLPTVNCHEHKTNKTCTDNNCKWDSKEKSEGDFCKHKDGAEQAKQKGTGAAAKEEAKKCSDKKKQEEYKDGCKWEGETCKDFTIIFNKKFALTAATLIALVGF